MANKIAAAAKTIIGAALLYVIVYATGLLLFWGILEIIKIQNGW